MIFEGANYSAIARKYNPLHLDIAKMPSAQKAPKNQFRSPRLRTMGKVEKYAYLNDEGNVLYLTAAEIKIRNEVKAQRVKATRAAQRAADDDYRSQETRAERKVRKDREHAKKMAEEARLREREGRNTSSRGPKSSAKKR